MDALSLLVDAANAQSTTQPGKAKQQRDERRSAAPKPRLEPDPSTSDPRLAPPVTSKVPSATANRLRERQLAELEFKEQFQRQALEREAQLAAMMSLGSFDPLGGLVNPSLTTQEAEYMQQFRLEALVQQRRQETLAQLALAQEYGGLNPEVQALLGDHQLRQAALLRDQALLMGGGGVAAAAAAGLDQGAGFRGRDGAANENPLLRLFEERDRQQKMATALVHPDSSGLGSPKSSSVTKNKNRRKLPTQDHSISLAGSKVTVLPCRARGMPMDHNAKTAYFVVPEDMKHGAELVCSYPACLNAGIKFRYCRKCQQPVAKRNFFKRHRHIGEFPADKVVEGLYKDDMVSTDTADALSESESSKEEPVTSKLQSKVDVNAILGKLSEAKAPELNESIFPPKSAVTNVTSSRKKAWEQLLGKRPRSGDEASLVTWVQQVLALSDLDRPLDVSDMIQVRAKEPAETLEVATIEKVEEEPKIVEKKEKTTEGDENGDEEKEGMIKTVEESKTEVEKKVDVMEIETAVEEGNKTESLEQENSNGHVEAVVDTSAENNPNEGEDTSIEDKTASIEQNDTGILYFETSSEDGSVDLRAQKKAKTE